MQEPPIQFQSQDEFARVAGYVPALTCTAEELKRIAGKYEWDESRALLCGLNGCNRRHWNGWVIETHGGDKTHCGRDCGEREFDVKFKDVEAVFKNELADAAKAANISDALQQRDALLELAGKLEDSASSLVTHVRTVVSLVSREPALLKAFNDSLRNDGRIQREVKVDRELLKAMGQRVDRVGTETIGLIDGGAAVRLQGSILGRVRAEAVWPLRHLTAESLAGLSSKALTKKSAEITGARKMLQEAEAFIEIAGRFTSAKNKREIAKLAEVVPSRWRNSRVAKIVQALSA